MEFIKNNFEIFFDEENIRYKSLIYNSDFDYLQKAPIKIFETNSKIYNFLFEAQNLINNGDATVENGELTVPVKKFIENINDEDSNFCYNMTLKKPVSFNLTIKHWGAIEFNSFKFSYKIEDKQYKNCKIVGCFALEDNEFYVLDKHLYFLFNAMKSVENIPNDDNKEYNIWKAINDVKEESVFSHSVLKSFFNNEKIIIPANMSVDIKQTGNNLQVIPTLTGLTEEEQTAFQAEIKSRYIDDTYSFNINGETIRIIISPKIKENFSAIFNMPREIRNNEAKRTIVKNRIGFLPNKDVVSLDNLSDRIVDFGMYKAKSARLDTTSNDWCYPIKISVFDISQEQIIFKLNDKLEMEKFREILEEAVANEYSFFDYTTELTTISIPLTPQNFKVLKQFLTVDRKETDKEDTKDKIIEEVKLLTNENKYIKIKITEALFEDLKAQVAQIKEFNADSDTIFNLNIYENQIPLNDYNKQQLRKVFEMHIILAQEDTLNEDDNSQVNEFFSNITLEIPKSLKREFKLKNYQKKGLAWLQNSFKMRERAKNARSGVLLADDMGLGKTLQILSFLFWLYDKDKYREIYFNETHKKPVLIVAPVILLDNWRNEYNKFFYDSLGTPLILHGDTLRGLKTRPGNEYYQFQMSTCKAELHLDTKEIVKSNVVITNYDTLVNYEFSFASIDWSIVVLDEAQEIKERSSHKSTVAKGLKTDFKIACTGTPVENSLMDLWNIFNFLQPNVLGTSMEFRSLCKSMQGSEDNSNNKVYNEIREKLYYEKPYAYILRREKKNVLGDLPPKTIEPKYEVPLSEEQIVIYDRLKNKMMFASTAEEKLKAFSDMHKFSQHPKMIDNKDTDSVEELISTCPKFQKLIEILRGIELKREKVLIFCNYREIQRYLKLVLEHEFNIDNIDIINGEAKNRQFIIDKFQEDENTFKILILSPRAAGVGLNIVKANHVIHYGRWWNPAKENQATDRAYRIGQEKEVHVYYLIDVYPNRCEQTFDEKLHNLIMRKIEIASNFLVPNDENIKEELINSFAGQITYKL